MTDLSTSLAQQESIIERGMQTFVEVGIALAEIRDKKLWMSGGNYASFDDYCKVRWEWNARYVQQVCKSAGVAKRLESSIEASEGRNTHNCALPKNEAQARPLAKLPESEQAEAWTEAVEESKAEGKPVTAAKVQKVVERRKQKSDPPEARRLELAEADEWEEVEDEPTKPAPKLENGREKVGPKDRKEALKLIGQLVRVLARMGIYEKYTKPLSAMIKEVEI